MNSQVLHAVWCYFLVRLQEENWNWSLAGVKGLLSDTNIWRLYLKDSNITSTVTMLHARHGPVSTFQVEYTYGITEALLLYFAINIAVAFFFRKAIAIKTTISLETCDKSTQNTMSVNRLACLVSALLLMCQTSCSDAYTRRLSGRKGKRRSTPGGPTTVSLLS